LTEYLPKRVSYTLKDLAKLWGVEESDLQQWIIHGELTAHTPLPLMSVFRVNALKAGGLKDHFDQELSHWEGHISISKYRCQRLFRHGRIYLREFICDQYGQRYVLPHTSDDIKVAVDDLVILSAEKERFGQLFQMQFETSSPSPVKPDAGSPALIFDVSFKIIHLEGKEYKFGRVQSRVLRLLYEAAQSSEPWRCGKTILHKAESQSFKMSNLFKRKPIWKTLILSNGDGEYRFNNKLTVSQY